MMVEPTQRQVDQSVEDSMNLFERAKVGRIVAVPPRRPAKALLVLDGSTQDEPSMAMARDLCERFGTALVVLDARETEQPDDLAARVAESLGAEALAKPAGSSYEQILAATESSKPEITIVPCPYQRDLDSVGPDSAGTVIDVLVARSTVPLLVIRKPFDPKSQMFARVRLVLTRENEAAPEAAAWVVGLVAENGKVRLVLLLEEEFYQNLKAVMPSIAPGVEVSHDALSSALAKTHERLHQSLRKASEEYGFDYQLDIRRQDESGSALPEDESLNAVIALPLERPDHASQGFVQEQIRLSPHPLLIVPCE
jgi:hypothetical protein